MTDILLLAGIVFGIALIVTGIMMMRRRPRRIKVDYFQEQWREMQKLCANKETWPQAIVDADKLLDKALQKKRYAGKTMGERLTKAQRAFSNNEAVWFGHKLRVKIDDDPEAKLKEADVKQALIGIRQALKDLGAFPKPNTDKTGDAKLSKDTAK
jgi:hypothetical protein